MDVNTNMKKNDNTNKKKNLNVVFVCTGNTCRSCMAEGVFRAIAEKNKSCFKAVSRGIHAFDGDPASEHSINALKTLWNIDISNHKAKMLLNDEVYHADFIFTMTKAQREILKAKFPEKRSNIFTLKEYVYPNINSESFMLDISDPYGMPYQIYENCAREIFQCVEIVMEKMR